VSESVSVNQFKVAVWWLLIICDTNSAVLFTALPWRPTRFLHVDLGGINTAGLRYTRNTHKHVLYTEPITIAQACEDMHVLLGDYVKVGNGQSFHSCAWWNLA